jgi:YjbR
VTENEFRRIALSLPETIEKSHVGHPDFRVKDGKIFATLGYPDVGLGVLILTPEHQGEFIGRHPEMFEPVKGKWGKRGSTQVVLKEAKTNVIESAMKLAWANAAPRKRK